jgi:hypothetical protein
MTVFITAIKMAVAYTMAVVAVKYITQSTHNAYL